MFAAQFLVFGSEEFVLLIGDLINTHVEWFGNLDLMHRFLVVVTVGQQVEASAAVAALDDRQHFRGQPLQLAHPERTRLNTRKIHTNGVCVFFLGWHSTCMHGCSSCKYDCHCQHWILHNFALRLLYFAGNFPIHCLKG